MRNRGSVGRLSNPSCMWLLAIGLLTALRATPALAHRLNVTAVVQGKNIVGEAYYVNGDPARDATVTALDPAGQPLGETTTDAEGSFSLPIRFRCDHRVQVQSGDHPPKATVVPAKEIPDTVPAWDGEVPAPGQDAPTTAPSEPAGEVSAQLKALQKQVAGLRQEVARYENKVRLHDVLGGIGCILGLMGLAFYFLGVRRKGRPECRKPNVEGREQ